MLRRPPRLIWRMLSGEVLRGLLLATAALVLVVAFGATIKPVSDGKLGPVEALKFMVVAVIPMLQFALPFGAGMAATLGYHRFASDNESVAASAGGVSYAAMLAPAAAIGLVLAGALLVVTNYVSPRFTRTLETIVTQDAAKSIIRQIERGESVAIENVILYADHAYRLPPPAGSDAFDYFILEGVVAVATDPEAGGVEADVTAQRADVWLYPGQRDGQRVTLATMVVEGGVGKRRGEAIADLGRTEFGPWVIPNALGDDLDFKTWNELEELQADPDGFRPIDRRRRRLAAALARQRVDEEIVAAAGAEARLSLIDDDGGRAAISGGSVEQAEGGWLVQPAGDARGVEVTIRRSDGSLRRHRAESVLLDVRVDERRAETRVDLEMRGVETLGVEAGRRASLRYTGYRLASDPVGPLFERDSGELLAMAAGAGASGPIGEASADLRKVAGDVRREIVAIQHERAALSTTGLVITALGAVMALRLRESMPLNVYLWSFFPALGAIITASGGASVAERHGAVGLVVVWSGTAVLLAFAVFEYARLRRH